MAQRDAICSIRDIIDSQLETADGVAMGRVADIELAVQEDGTLLLTALLIGPQALAGRISPRLQQFLRLFLRNRFESKISLDEVVVIGPTLRLRQRASAYTVGQSERWLAKHILRWIPGSGYRWH